jgi:hypothetical protein
MSSELKRTVEQAVRPVQAVLAIKMRMREELLAHIETIAEEEASHGGTPEEQLGRTRERFGDPESLTVELAKSLGWNDRVEGRLQGWVERRLGESAVSVATRVAGVVLFWNALGLVLVTAARAMPESSGINFWIALAAVVGMLTIDAFAITWLAVTCSTLAKPPHPPVFLQPRIWLAGIAAAIVVGVMPLVAVAIAGRGQPLVDRVWGLSAWTALAAVPLFVSLMYAFQRERRQAHEWESLELTGNTAASESLTP